MGWLPRKQELTYGLQDLALAGLAPAYPFVPASVVERDALEQHIERRLADEQFTGLVLVLETSGRLRLDPGTATSS